MNDALIIATSRQQQGWWRTYGDELVGHVAGSQFDGNDSGCLMIAEM